MQTNRLTISEAVENHLRENLLLQESIALGFCNISAVASFLKPDIIRSVGTPVSITTLGMAIRRCCKKLALQPRKQQNFPTHIDISARTNMYEVAVANNDKTRSTVDKLRVDLQIAKGDLLTVAEGLYEIVVFTNEKYKPKVKKVLRNTTVTSEMSGLGLVTVNWPASTKGIPGIYFRITRALAIRNISIQSFHTIGSEMMILFSGEQFGAGYHVIHQLLANKLKD